MPQTTEMSGKIIKVGTTLFLEVPNVQLYKITDGKSRKPFNQNRFNDFLNHNVIVDATKQAGVLYIYNIRKHK